MKKSIKNLIGKLAFPLIEYSRYTGLTKSLAVRRVDKSGVYVFGKPEGKNRLNVIKLASRNNSFLEADFDSIKRTTKHLDDSQAYYFFVKQGDYQVGYLATFSEQIAVGIEDTLYIKRCGTEETVNFLLDVFSVNTYSVSKEHLDIQPHIVADKLSEDNFFDPLYYNFSTVIRDGVSTQYEKYDLYQVVKFNYKLNFNYTDNYSKNFNGILAVFLDLSDKGTSFLLDKYTSYAKTFDSKLLPKFQFLKDQEKLDKLKGLVVNAVILCDDEREAKNTASSFGFEVIKKEYDKLNIFRNSFLLTREMDYDKILPVEYISKVIGVRSRKNLTRVDCEKLEKPWTQISIDTWGEDMYGGFVNYCCRANDNPHVVLIADAGTGKSTALQKFLANSYRIDLEEEKAHRFHDIQTRYFEIGYSSTKLVSFFKKLFPDEVQIIEGGLDSFGFSSIDIKLIEDDNGRLSLEQDSKQLSLYLTNVILREGGVEPLTGLEQDIYFECLEELYLKKQYKQKTVSELRRMSKKAFKEYDDTFTGAGYSATTRLNEIEDCGDIENLQKPTVEDLIIIMETKSQSTNNTQVRRDVYNATVMKLRAIKAMEGGLFGVLNSLRLDGKKFYSFEFNDISNNASLTRIIFSFLFAHIYQRDVRHAQEMKRLGKKMPQTFYIFEESRNFIQGNPDIVAMMSKLVFEGRKWQIHGIFIAQQTDHIPDQLITGCSTFMFLMPQEQERSEPLKKSIRKYFPEQDSVEFLMKNIKQHTFGIISSSGVFACKQILSPKELEMFSV